MLNNYSQSLHHDHTKHWSAHTLREQVQTWSAWLSGLAELRTGHASIGILADNSPDWIALDLATNTLGYPLVPLPSFFTKSQLEHLVSEAQVTFIITDQPQSAAALGFLKISVATNSALHVMQHPRQHAHQLPKKVQKLTFTSGTTGAPKGVCLDKQYPWEVAQSLFQATHSLNIQTHLCLLPFSVLLENIAGVYAPLLANAAIACPPLHQVGMTGVSQFNPLVCLDAIARFQAESVIVLPQMLQALLACLSPNDARVKTLKFVAVGGGKVPLSLLTQAESLGLPVFEGYGLSECASVVCLNTPTHHHRGTVGKPLEHIEVRVANDQEIWVKGPLFLGYLHALKNKETYTPPTMDWFPTGDLGELSNDGFLSIHGRKKHLIITSFGRNISPEWPESVIQSSGAFLQVLVFGDAQPHLTAVLVPHTHITPSEVEQAILWSNAQLPDYAQIKTHVVSHEAFTPSNGLCTPNGRIKRDAVFALLIQPSLQTAPLSLES